MSQEAVIRSLERRDLGELVQLCREHAEYERAAWTEQDRADKLHSMFLTSNQARCWVVEAGEELAGFATANLERSTWDAEHYLHLDCLYLRVPYRGRGIGRALMKEVAQAALEMGVVNVQWQTPAWNDDAVRFYRRFGATSKEKLRFTLDPAQCRSLLDGSKEEGVAAK